MSGPSPDFQMSGGTLSLKQIVEQIKAMNAEFGVRFFRLAVQEGLQRVIARTPIDTGRARGNWYVSAGSPTRQVQVEGWGPGGKAGTPAAAAVSAAALARGMEVVKTLGVEMPAYVVNNVAYMGRLEAGHSPQAPGPGGIVAITVQELKQILPIQGQRLIDSLRGAGPPPEPEPPVV